MIKIEWVDKIEIDMYLFGIHRNVTIDTHELS